ALPDDFEEIDEDSAVQHPVDLLFTNRVLAHQPPQSRYFVVVVMVNVKIREAPPPVVGPSDEALERAFLTLAVMSPPVPEYQRAVLPEGRPEEIFTAVIDQRIALHVEE